MKTAIYNIWSDLVENFVKTIGDGDPDLAMQILPWLETEGAQHYKDSQGIFFRRNLAKYQQTQHPCSAELYDLAKDQIIAGFLGWFEAMLKQFPVLDTPSTQENYKQFALDCVAEKYSAFIAVRAVATGQLVRSGNLRDIGKTIKIYTGVIDACQTSIESMQEHVRTQTPAQTAVAIIPRGPSSPAFHKEVQSNGVVETIGASGLKKN